VIAWVAEEHSLGSGYQVHRSFLEDAMEEDGD
jgi:hypothetical protein